MSFMFFAVSKFAFFYILIDIFLYEIGALDLDIYRIFEIAFNMSFCSVMVIFGTLTWFGE